MAHFGVSKNEVRIKGTGGQTRRRAQRSIHKTIGSMETTNISTPSGENIMAPERSSAAAQVAQNMMHDSKLAMQRLGMAKCACISYRRLVSVLAITSQTCKRLGLVLRKEHGTYTHTYIHTYSHA